MCASSRYLLVGGLAGMGASTFTGSDLVGLLVGVAAALLLYVAVRRFPGRLGPSSCALPAAEHAAGESLDREQPAPDGMTAR